MKGIVFNILEEVVTEEHGEETWDKLLSAAGAKGTYTSLGSYPDEELLKIVGAASKALNTPPADVLRWFGRKAMPHFIGRYPHFFRRHKSTRPFLLTLNSIIHPEVRKLYPGAHVPVFGFDDSRKDRLLLTYASEKKLCTFAEGLIHGAADHFGETVTIEQTECMLRGDPRCILACTFSKKGR